MSVVTIKGPAKNPVITNSVNGLTFTLDTTTLA